MGALFERLLVPRHEYQASASRCQGGRCSGTKSLGTARHNGDTAGKVEGERICRGHSGLSRSTRRSTLPVFDLGNSSRISIRRGILYEASRSRQKSDSSSAVT